ncbi:MULTISPECIES: discoidin domain-containing protein [Microcystis]|uniref:discoidin domain-containing protein n=1 Tax=Microcystis TaxID=1125 RepID=UPI0020A239F2|nr:discoidin domain-containing protein [Microcystis aeruginosa]
MLAVPQNAQAAGLIRNVTATQSFMGSGQGDINFTTNGKGLVGPPANTPSLTGNHSSTIIDTLTPANSNAWRSASGVSGTPLSSLRINFAFGRVYNLAGFSFWNFGGSTTTAGQGINAVRIEYSSDGGTNWTPLTGLGVPTSFAQGPSGAGSTIAVQQFSFSPVLATNVRFSNMTIHSGADTGSNARVGFNEIQFRSIPEPSTTLALLAFGLAAVGLRKRI